MKARQLAATVILTPIARLPDGLKVRLRRSALQPVYSRIYDALGHGIGSGIYRIEGGPLRGQLISIDPGVGRAYLLGNYEPSVTKAILSRCRAGMIVCDAGAHNGYFSMIMAQAVGQTGLCLAFEPNPINLQRIKESIIANNLTNLRAEGLALGDHDGETSFRLHDNLLMGRLEHLVPPEDVPMFQHEERVSICKLDTYMEEQSVPQLNFLKIDVEGAERELIEGASKTIRAFRPSLLIEVHSFMNVQQAIRPLISYLAELKYQLTDIAKQTEVSYATFRGGHVLAIPEV